MDFLELQNFLDSKVEQYNRPEFIEHDPICIPHLFCKKQDIEIAGFFAAILAWGQRKTIINKCKELMGRMDNAPHDFVLNHQDHDLKKLLDFKHRTFNDTDLLYFITFFKNHYTHFTSLEQAFIPKKEEFTTDSIEVGIMNNQAATAVMPIDLFPIAPAPEAIHNGIKPATKAKEVINMGRNLDVAPILAASITVAPSFLFCSANSIIRIAFLPKRPINITSAT